MSETISLFHLLIKKKYWLRDYFVTARLCLAAVGAASSGGDFMSDLFNKLAMRRKGEEPSVFQVRLRIPILVNALQ